MTPSEARNVLGLNPNSQLTRRDITDAYRANVKRTHPDAGGNSNEFTKAQEAAKVLQQYPDPPTVFKRRFSVGDFDEIRGDLARFFFTVTLKPADDGGISISGLPPGVTVTIKPAGVTITAAQGWMNIDQLGNRSYGTAAGDTGTQ